MKRHLARSAVLALQIAAAAPGLVQQFAAKPQ